MAGQADAQMLNRSNYLNTKLMKTYMNIYFNKTCKKLKAIPKYINIQIKCTSQAIIKAKDVISKFDHSIT